MPASASRPDAGPVGREGRDGRDGRWLLRRTLRRRARATLGGLALITVWQSAEALVPVLIGVAIDQAVATGDLPRGLLWAAVLTVHFAVLSTGYRLGSRVLVGAIQRESHELRCEVAGHVLAPHGVRTERLSGEVLTLATGDADLVGQVVHQIAATGAAVVGLLVTSVALVVIDPVLALVVLAGVPVVLVLTRWLGAPIEARTTARQEALGRASGVATDLVRGLRPLSGIGGQDAGLARYRRESRDAVRRSVDAARWEGLLIGVTDALGGIFLAAVALLAGLRALDGEIGIGELVAVVGLAQFLAEPLGLVASLIAQVAQSRSAAGRIAGFLAAPPLVLSGTTPGRVGGLALDAVHHGPLRGVSLHADPGEVVAVVADDPADAAALVRLCHGEAAPEQGVVTLGGVPLVEQGVDDRARRLLVADHHVDLFAGTLATNVDPAGAADPAALRAALVATAADDVVAQAPGGLDEPVAAGGSTLSGGQAQRLALARALVADPEVLVLHDPTSAVDAVTEHRVAAGLRALRHPTGPDAATGAARATVVLTSSPALLAQADRVVHLREGRVVAVGTHHDLSASESYAAAVLR